MKRSGSSTNALLEKVSSQLRGERVKKKDDDDEALNAYIKSLSQKTAQQRGKSVEFEEMGDISISSELDTHDTSSSIKRRAVTTSGSKFLKKKTNNDPQPASKFLKKPQVSSASPVPTVSEQVRGHSKQMSNDKPGQRSAALDKASLLSKKITTRSNENRKVFTLETDSESLETPRQITPQPDSDSFKIGKNSKKFLKKKQPEQEDVVNKPESPKLQNTEKKSKASPFKLRSSAKYSTDVVLSSGEESLQEFIFGADGSDDSGRIKGGTIKTLSHGQTRQEFRKRAQSPMRSPSPDSKPPTPSSRTPRRSPSPKIGRRSPSPAFRRSRSHSEDSNVGDTMASDIIEEVNESDVHSESSGDIFKVNLMDADTLEPVIIAKPNINNRKSRDVTKKKEEKKKKRPPVREEEKDDLFGAFGLHTVEELLGDVQDLEGPPSEASEIKTASESEEIKTEKSDHVFGKSKQSRSEVMLKTHSTTPKYSSYSEDFDSSISERIGESTKHIKTVSEINTKYSDEETEISEGFISDSISMMTESRATPTSDRTITDSYTYTETTPPPRKSKVKTKSTEVQTAEPGLHYQWDSKYSGFAVPGFLSGLGMVDPTPIATHVVSPDALEAMTAYSPAMLALHDMLKQQLDLTRSFVESQKYLYKSFADSMESTYKYTTLEDTKRYIQKHRPKTLTFKEAMKMVKSEMKR